MRAMLPDGRRIGTHLPLGYGLIKAADRAKAIGADTIQVFTDNPTAWRRRAEPPRELEAFRELLDEQRIHPVISHASYLINPAGPPTEVWDRSLGLLISELEVAPTFGVGFVNVHIGSHLGAGVEAGIAQAAEAAARALAATESTERSVVLLLENSVASGDGVGVDPVELGAILAAAGQRGADPERLGICLDTAHAWGAGHDVGDPRGVDALLKALDLHVGLGRVRLIHLNDSREALGSRADRHEHLGHGRIGVAGLRRLLTHPSLRHVTYILETPGMDEGYDAVNLERAYRIAAGRRLATLPADAPTGSRTAAAAPRPQPERAA